VARAGRVWPVAENATVRGSCADKHQTSTAPDRGQ